MNRFILVTWLGLFILLVSTVRTPSAAEPAGLNRRAADEAARERFRETHLFYKGRGMHLAPDFNGMISLFQSVLGADAFEKRSGIVVTSSTRVKKKRLEGLFQTDYQGMSVAVLGCVACHSGRAAGQFIVGLGNKNIDPLQIGKDAYLVQKIWKTLHRFKKKTPAYRELEKNALVFAQYLANEKLGNLTQGLVPVSFVRGWFYRMENLPVPEDFPKGQVKVPSLWGYGQKRLLGQFCDGFGDGEKVGWAAAVELAAGQTPEAIREMEHDIEEVEALFTDFLPPPYPFSIDQVQATRGQQLFEKTCARCHGRYPEDSEGLPIYAPPKWIPWHVVKTDSDRLDGNTDAFIQLVDRNPLNDLVRANRDRRGYFAPRLHAIWARFPYLHNGSVPTIRDLLRPASQRPKKFSLKDAGDRARFDAEKIGLTPALPRFYRKNDRRIFDTRRVGHSNQGHEFFVDLAETQVQDLLEYLKTL